MTISNSEMYIMDIVWANGGTMEAREIAQTLQRQLSLSKTTVYTMINRLIAKEALKRDKDVFLCHAAVTKTSIREEQTKALIDRLYDGSLSVFVEEYLMKKDLSQRERVEIKRMVQKL